MIQAMDEDGLEELCSSIKSWFHMITGSFTIFGNAHLQL